MVLTEAGFLRFPLDGPRYYELFKELNAQSKPRGYFEIGVSKGGSMSKFDCLAVGVDPGYRVEVNIVGRKPALHLFQETSDDFFEKYKVGNYLTSGLDIAFLDGLHLFEFLLRDFYNTEANAHPGSIILLHDCLPINAEMTERERRPERRKDQELRGGWTGDVWKVIPILQTYRSDLELTFIDSQPTGIVAVRNLDPSSTVLKDNYPKIFADYIDVLMSDDDLVAYRSKIRLTTQSEFLKTVIPFQ